MRKLELDLDDRSSLAKAIGQLNREDGQLLNKLLVEHLKSLRENSYAEHMAQFRVGDKVIFEDKSGQSVEATVLRLNRKTASLVCSDGERWNVAPQLLQLQQPDHAGELDLFPGGRPHLDSSVSDSNSGQSQDRLQNTLADQQKASVTHLPGTAKGAELIGGILTMPGQITGEGAAYQPVVIVWVDAHGIVLNMSVSHPDKVMDELQSSLQETLEKLALDGQVAPNRIRMADAQAIETLRAAFPKTEFQLGETPEVSELRQSMLEHFTGTGSAVTYLSSGASAEALDAMFSAAAALYSAKPWERVPHDQCLIGVSIPSLGIEHAVISVIGQQRQNLGFLYFNNLKEHEQYLVAVDSIPRGKDVAIPPYTALTFEQGKDIDDAQRKEITKHQWKVANNKAYPDIFTPGVDQTRRPITPRDIALMEILCRAIPEALGALDSGTAWQTGYDKQRLSTVANVHSGDVDVEFNVPFAYETVARESGYLSPLMGQLMAVGRASEDVDWDMLEPLDESLMAHYSNSQERQKLDNNTIVISTLLTEFAAGYMKATVATLLPSELEEILFDIVPRKVALDADDAADIIAEARAFYTYLGREHGLWRAQACLDVLNNNARDKLASALGNTDNFGMGKGLLAQAAALGYDINTPEGINQYMNAVTRGEVNPDLSGWSPGGGMSGFMPTEPAPPVIKPVNKKARKNKRKTARKARKKNR